MPARRFTSQDKEHILTMLHSGVSKKTIARLLQIDRRDITIWDLRYQRYGVEGLEPRFKHTIPAATKRQIVEEYLNGGISMRQLCTEHNICLSTLKNWRKKYLEENNIQIQKLI